jgi:hypothetical protein
MMIRLNPTANVRIMSDIAVMNTSLAGKRGVIWNPAARSKYTGEGNRRKHLCGSFSIITFSSSRSAMTISSGRNMVFIGRSFHMSFANPSNAVHFFSYTQVCKNSHFDRDSNLFSSISGQGSIKVVNTRGLLLVHMSAETASTAKFSHQYQAENMFS